ncbi:MAG TPA: LacI family DNA-binding transcriptional regulator [Jatrophihabitantaceae bacterium]|jgi:DNA-binding LacI/PurR family transcriptional regulator
MTSSIEDVAKLAGVSIATVSRSLRGLPDVAAATRDRVLAAARELNYVASPFAARLASGRAATVGVVVPFVHRWYFAEVLGAVENVLGRAGFDLLLYNLGDHDGRRRFFDLMPVRKRVDAIVFASLVLSDAEADALQSLNVPVGMVGVDRPGVHSTRIDDEEAARSAVRHLVDLGHRRIALIGGDTDDPMRFTPPHHRRVGYLDALREAGIEYDPKLEALGYFTVDGGAAATQILLDRPDRPTALFAESDEMAYGAIRAIRRAGLRVPQDVAVVGFDDHASAELLDLSTVHQPVIEQAEELTTRLLAAITDADITPYVRVLPTELVVRGSTDPSRSVY